MNKQLLIDIIQNTAIINIGGVYMKNTEIENIDEIATEILKFYNKKDKNE